MDQPHLNWIANYIWGIADDVLRDLYVRGKYRDVILPMTVVRGSRMTRRAPEEDGRTYWGGRPDELAAHCVEHAATHGWTLALQPDTPRGPRRDTSVRRLRPRAGRKHDLVGD